MYHMVLDQKQRYHYERMDLNVCVCKDGLLLEVMA